MAQGTLFGKIADAVRGLKTLVAAAAFILLGLADYTQVVNLQPLLQLVFGENIAAKIMILMPIVFGTLRFVTDGRVRFMRAKDEVDPDRKEPF